MANICGQPSVLTIEIYEGTLATMRVAERHPVCAAHAGVAAIALMIVFGRKLVLDVSGDERCAQPLPEENTRG